MCPRRVHRRTPDGGDETESAEDNQTTPPVLHDEWRTRPVGLDVGHLSRPVHTSVFGAEGGRTTAAPESEGTTVSPTSDPTTVVLCLGRHYCASSHRDSLACS